MGRPSRSCELGSAQSSFVKTTVARFSSSPQSAYRGGAGTLLCHQEFPAWLSVECCCASHPPSVDVAMAVSIPGGLVTPVLKNVDERDVFTLTRNWRNQLAAAQARDFAAAGLTGGTFYISNLGMSGIEQFDALLPQNVGCIMAVGSVRNVLMPDGAATNRLGQKKQMNVTLTCDHRHIYGQHAADFLTVSLCCSSWRLKERPGALCCCCLPCQIRRFAISCSFGLAYGPNARLGCCGYRIWLH